MKGIIYKYTFSDGKVYIGQTRRHPEKRRREHFDEAKGPTNSAFWEAYKRLGEPRYEEIYETENDNVDLLVHDLNIKEMYFIHKFKADDPHFGYNVRHGGYVPSGSKAILAKLYGDYMEALKAIMLEPYKIVTHKLWNTNEPLTKDELFLIKDRYRENNPFQQNIDKYNLNNISMRRKMRTDFFFEEAIDFIQIIIIKEAMVMVDAYIRTYTQSLLEEERSKNTILQIDKQGNLVREFNSTTEICQSFKVPRADNVLNVLRGKQKTAYGYYWKYKND